ncbi:MAG: glycosyltransferase family 4 protein [Candidatus Cloacimonetes bacterium]|nr:glycosyltransferase family 4 protein [Candidatus Cloacimonadota bacterium]
MKNNPESYRIFVSGMAYDEGKSGVSDYINNIVKALSINHQVDMIMLESDVCRFPVSSPNLKIIPVSDKLKNAVINMLWHLFILPGKYNLKSYDFIFLPAANRRLLASFPIPSIVTFHDLSQFHIPAKYDAFRMFYIKIVIPFFVKKADKILAISKNTKEDLIKFYKMSPESIEVNYNGYDSQRYQPAPASVLKPLGISKKYFLYIARIEHPGKNHLRLIKAYEDLPVDLKNRYDLVLPGKNWSGSEIVLEYLKNSPDKERIHLPGFVDSEVLPALYQQCSLYIFPSLYEGFGIPLIEAMASGVPVVCSNTSSLPEIGGEAIALFDPYSELSIRETIWRVISSEIMQKAMIANGFKQVKQFSWKKHADKIIQSYQEIVSRAQKRD